MISKRIKYEDEILDEGVRKQIIEEIEGFENTVRKAELYKRHLLYKDQTNRFVVDNLLRQFDRTTVSEMHFSVSNISILKKVIDKLARVYNNGVERTVNDDKEGTEEIQKVEKTLSINTVMKKTNRVLKRDRNTAVYLKPCPVYSSDGKTTQWKLKPENLPAYLYDVVEDYNDRTSPLVFILSDYNAPNLTFSPSDVAVRPVATSPVSKGDGIDQKIADTPEDAGKGEQKTYTFWSKSHHFTCDSQGRIVPDPGNIKNENPFKTQMIVDFAIDQDGQYWAEGGDDLVEGSILINTMITHLNNIAVLQSYGQFYMTGENLPRSISVGPNKVLLLEYKKDDNPEPKAGFLNANPNLDSYRGAVEAYVALLLTTNNLSTSGVSAQLSGSKDVASGIALVIDKAESLEDVQDQRQLFQDKEPSIWNAIQAFYATYKSQLVEEQKDLSVPEDIAKTIVVTFNDVSAIISEKEKLDILKVRKDLGLDSMIGLLMRDDPNLTRDQAEKKLKQMLEDKMKEQTLRGQLGLDLEPNPQDPNKPQDPNDPNKADNEETDDVEDPTDDESDSNNSDRQGAE